MKDRKLIELAVLIGLVLGLILSPLAAQTPACGSEVSGTVVFNGPMTCTLDDLATANRAAAITVVADGTTIDLAGYTMLCKETVTELPCQNKNVPKVIPETPVAIDVNGFTNVVIKGPGTIDGFDRSIVLTNVAKGSVVDLVVTGPTAENGTWSQSSGPQTTGIRVTGASCPGAVIIDGNNVNRHRYGIVVENSSCVKVQRNQINGNRGFDATGAGSHGLLLLNSSGNTVTNNWLERNGLYNPTVDGTAAADGGITLQGVGTSGNRVAQNTLTHNCGDGISARAGAQGNPIGNNSATSNGVNEGILCRLNGEYPLVPAYDFAEYTSLPSNTWRRNNDCATQNPLVPDGVCTTTVYP